MDDILTRTRAAVWHPCTQMKQLEAAPPLAVARGEGVWLVDTDGRRYFDAISSWWVNLFGHCNPRINAAIVDQLGKIEHVMLAGATHEPVVELSERLAQLTGLGHAFYGSDGASATEIALKMSAHYWRNAGWPEKNGFVSLENAYHGETVGALSVTDIPLFKSTYAPLVRHSAQVPTPDARRAEPGESAEAFALRCADALEAHLAEHAATTAAFIVEPLVQGAAGMAMYHPAYVARARELCDRYRVHLIADEIAVGFGRTGTLFACEQAGVRPDFLCLSKGITGGYLPLSAVLTTDAVYAAFYGDDTARGFLHSHSYTGNPLACRAALATLDIFEQDSVIESNHRRKAVLDALAAPLASHPRVAAFRQRGMIWAFDVRDAPPGFARDFARNAQHAGVLLRPIGNTVYFMPPYVTGDEEMAFLVDATLHLLETT
ncbi:MAG: adenosylmethionine--8-amino-7-oxononanoate transaminase [Thiobacillus sp.]|nr:adenosylmethionine--8-amino-7-oxononanoate transaminase [Thiobacillus sp.]